MTPPLASAAPPPRTRALLAVAMTLVLAGCGDRAGQAPESGTLGTQTQRLTCTSGSSTNPDADPGALIVDLGVTPQTQGNALKPYGLVYDLVVNQKIPLLWAYRTTKTSDADVDFTVDGHDFRGSAFIIPGAYVTSAQATVNRWVAQGVVVFGPTKKAFTPPTFFRRLTGFPNVVLDPQTGPIAQGYLTAAGFPTFPVKLPTALNACQDMFVLPHADPTWANHGNLRTFVQNGGFLWVGCHAVSVLEGIDGDGDGAPDLAFLSSTGLVNFGRHAGATPPYSLDSSSLGEPVMQFLGKVDTALSNGSEQVYLPLLGGAWRPTTRVAVFDPAQADVVAGSSPGKAAKVTWGRGYGQSTAGIVMYEGGHNFGGTGADQIAAQRAFLNFVLWNASDKSVVVRASVPSQLLGGQQVSLTSTVTSLGSITSYQWTSTCGGTFGTPTAANTTFTPPAGSIKNTPCVLRLTAVDSCNRVGFDAPDTVILGQPDLAVTVSGSTTTPTVNSKLDYTVTATDVGGLPVQNVVVTITLAPTSRYANVKVTPSVGKCTQGSAPGDNVWTCSLGDVDPCSPATITVSGDVTGTGAFDASVTGTTTSKDADLGSNAASTSGFAVVQGNNPVLTKSVYPAPPAAINPGSTLTWTLTLYNGGTTTLNNIHVFDAYPTGTTTYVASSATVTYPRYQGTVADSFPGISYSASTGTQPWSGSWLEVLESAGAVNSPTQGKILVKKNNICPSLPDCLYINQAKDKNGIQRSFSLKDASAAALTFNYKVPTNKANATAQVEVSTDGGATWRNMTTGANALSLANKITVTTAMSLPFLASELADNVTVRFTTNGTAGAVWVIDDVVVNVDHRGEVVTRPGSTPAGANTFDLTQNLSGVLTLKPGDTVTVTFQTTVNAAVAPGSTISNTGTVKTTETGATVTSSNTVSVTTATSTTKAPVAAQQSLTFNEDAQAAAMGITAPTDADTSAANLTVRVLRVPSPTQASLALADGTPVTIGQTMKVSDLTGLTFSGFQDFNGSADPFVYEVSDPEKNVSVGNVALTVTAGNDAPVAFDDGPFLTQKGQAADCGAPGNNDTDVDGFIDDELCDLDPATAGQQTTFTTAAGTWTLDLNASDATYLSVIFTPVATFTGTATLRYASSDDGTPLPAKASNAATITVRVNAPPTAAPDTLTVRSVGGTVDVAANDTDSDGSVDQSTVDLDPVTAGLQTTFTVAGKGTFTVLGDGIVRFVPVAGFAGPVTASYTVMDLDGGTSNAATIAVTVNPCVSNAECDDGNPCTTDTCSAGACSNANSASGTACNDGNPGTKGDACDGAGACRGTVYTCAPTQCQATSVPNGTGCTTTAKADGLACDDGSACTRTDTCQAGSCTGTNPVTCTAQDACHDVGTCNPATGTCSNPAKPNGTACDDGNACTQTDTCQSGACAGGNAVTCAAQDQCHVAGTCNPATGACTNPAKANGTACDDGNACTQADTCQSGACAAGGPVSCADPTKPVCDASSGSCGCSSNAQCKAPTPVCDTGSKTCVGCFVDPDCTAAQYCNTPARSCAQKVPNGSPVPTVPGHTPVLGGTCTAAAGATACQSGVCDTADNLCGYANGDGPCSQANAASVCRSGVCDPDGRCGLADGDGPCTQANGASVCRSGICSVSGVCQPSSGCAVDGDCASTQFCNTQTKKCVAKLANDTPIPTIAGHTPALNGACSAPVGSAVCASAVCDASDNRCGSPNGRGACTPASGATVCRSAVCDPDGKCGYANGDGPCTQANGGTVCRSAVCSVDGKCGLPGGEGPCSAADAATTCRSGQCSTSGRCLPPGGGCLIDGDCTSAEFCDTAQSKCVPRLANGKPMPTIAGHSPILDGTCTSAAATAVCVSVVCDLADAACGFANGTGPCTPADASKVCRSAVCSVDGKCGLPGGEGPCTTTDAATVCRSGACSKSGKCLPPGGGCLIDGDCGGTEYCDTAAMKCAPKLANGAPIPSVAGHSPTLDGNCTAAAAGVVCLSNVCDADNRCGYGDGHGPCTSSDATVVCRSGSCSPSTGNCIPSGGCVVDADCAATEFCDTAQKTCAAKLANGKPLPVISGHSPALDGTCSAAAAKAVCVSAVCDAADDDCGLANGHGPCTATDAGTICRSGVCGGDGSCGFGTGEGPCTAADAATVCRSGACSKSGKCLPPGGGCLVDADCASTELCDTPNRTCAPKLANGKPLPTVPGHSPTLDGSCSAAAAQAACLSAVCDAADASCGLANGHGPCTATDGASVCRSAVCGSDGKCGLPDGEGPCTFANGADLCRSQICSVSGKCQPPASCTVDGDCAATQYCDTPSKRCRAKLPNGSPLPSVPGHSPTVDGTCTAPAASAVCLASICDAKDDACGLANGDGPCTAANGATVCRSAVCDPKDGRCGLDDGDGPCTQANASTTCRSGSCSANGSCIPAASCAVDADCAASQFCDTARLKCAPRLLNGDPMPTVAGHTPTLDGTCTAPASSAVCVSRVCDAADDRCGYANGDGPCTATDGPTVCRSAVCGTDGDCGIPDGEGPCTAATAPVICRSGACSASSLVCIPPGGCLVDGDCAATQYCDTPRTRCVAKVPNGQPVPSVPGHAPTLDGKCTAAAGTAACASAVCDPKDDACGLANGDGPCTQADAATVCRGGVCGADGKCGLPDGVGPCTPADAAQVCRSGRCSADGRCRPDAACLVDADCSSMEFCDTQQKKCLPKLPNGEPVPKIAGHVPTLDGTCTADAGTVVCASNVCDPADQKCGLSNGDGPCTPANGASICRSGVCGADGKCGEPDDGPCDPATGPKVCRSGICSSGGRCIPGTSCGEDGDCDAHEYCDTQDHVCTPKLPNGSRIPTHPGHAPPLEGRCTPEAGAAACASGVCDPADDRCGLGNGAGPCTPADGVAVCRGGACGADGKCGLADGEGPCTSDDAQGLCRSAACTDGVCGSTPPDTAFGLAGGGCGCSPAGGPPDLALLGFGLALAARRLARRRPRA